MTFNARAEIETRDPSKSLDDAVLGRAAARDSPIAQAASLFVLDYYRLAACAIYIGSAA